MRLHVWIDIHACPSNMAAMLELEEARRRILAAIEPLPAEFVALNAAAGRVLAEDIRAPMDLPPFDNSAMDGYAVRSDDTIGGCSVSPARLKLCGKIAAGEGLQGVLEPGTCMR